MVPRVAMFTMAGETFLIIGDRDGMGVSATAGGIAAEAIGASITALASDAAQASRGRFMTRSSLRRQKETVPPQGTTRFRQISAFQLLIVILRGWAVGVLGIVTSSTPLVCLAVIDSVLAPSGSLKRRRKAPETRSTRS